MAYNFNILKKLLTNYNFMKDTKVVKHTLYKIGKGLPINLEVLFKRLFVLLTLFCMSSTEDN